MLGFVISDLVPLNPQKGVTGGHSPTAKASLRSALTAERRSGGNCRRTDRRGSR